MQVLEAFLEGYEAKKLAPNMFDCTSKYRDAVVSLNNTNKYMDDKNATFLDKTFNLTQTISGSVADSFEECGMAAFYSVKST